MARAKYKFDLESLDFKKIELTPQERAYQLIVKNLSPSLLIGFGLFILASYLFDSPEERSLKYENEQLKLKYEMLNQKFSVVENVVEELASRDDNIYRAIFGLKPVPLSIRQAGVGGSNRYNISTPYASSKLVAETSQRLENLSHRLVVQSKSHDEVEELVKNKQKRLSSIPAIQPVHNKDLRHRPYGYGPRIDPVYGTPAFHHGMDFSAPTGTPIYATGDGVVTRADALSSGFGNHVRIEHGFGYKTLYAHMSKILVRPGQKIKRGEVIGLVGNTGKSVGPHLHYEVWVNGTPVNPMYFYYDDLSPEDYDKMITESNSTGHSLD